MVDMYMEQYTEHCHGGTGSLPGAHGIMAAASGIIHLWKSVNLTLLYMQINLSNSVLYGLEQDLVELAHYAMVKWFDIV